MELVHVNVHKIQYLAMDYIVLVKCIIGYHVLGFHYVEGLYNTINYQYLDIIYKHF